jgi:hypothetical protein
LEWAFGFENGPDVEAISNASEFFRYTPYIRRTTEP